VKRLLLLSLLVGCATTGQPPAPEPAEPPGLQLESFDWAWQRIAESHPDPAFEGTTWTALLEQYRPRAAQARTPAELRPVLRAMFAELGESHYGVLGSSVGEALGLDAGVGGDGTLGLTVRYVGDEAYVTRVERGPAADAGVAAGWALLQAGRVDPTAALNTVRASLTSERGAALYADRVVTAALDGPAGTFVEVRLRDGEDTEHTLRLERVAKEGQLQGFGNLPPTRVVVRSDSLDGVGYIAFNIFLPAVSQPFDAAMKRFVEQEVAGVVIDLRGNPGGLGAMVISQSGWFLGDREIKLAELITRQTTLHFSPNPRARRHEGKLAVLVDGLSASTSEILAGGLQAAGRARIFGATTAGMALPSLIERMPNGDALQFVTADLVDGAGRRLEGVGVVPDEPVPLTRAALLTGQDPVLEAARAWILEEPQ